MKPDEIHITDVYRLVFGQTPASFMIEVGIRALLTYVLLLVATRLMGKRVAGQMSVTELTIMITLGAAIGVPLQAPERGMLPAVIILGVAIAYEWVIGRWSFSSRRAEVALQGDVTVLVRDGRIDIAEMRGNGLSRERLFSVLRQSGMVQLGQAKRVYMEADGHFSVFQSPKPPPGLCLLPEEDRLLYQKQLSQGDRGACRSCGTVVECDATSGRCPSCGEREWSKAVRTVELNEFRSADELKASASRDDGEDDDTSPATASNDHRAQQMPMSSSTPGRR